jgi:hypothetical protein
VYRWIKKQIAEKRNKKGVTRNAKPQNHAEISHFQSIRPTVNSKRPATKKPLVKLRYVFIFETIHNLQK